MIECKELTGKVIQSLTLHDGGSDGPEVSIDFTDGTNFTACLSAKLTLEAKRTRDDGGQPIVIEDYTMPVNFR